MTKRHAALGAAIAELKRSRAQEPEANAEFALAHVLGCKRTELSTRQATPGPWQRRFKAIIHRIAGQHQPLSYALGCQDFMGIKLKVKAGATLIPRPETEELVAAVLGTIKTRWPRTTPLRLLDVGTGSGAIAIALWHFLHRHRQIDIVATDISSAALAIARANARNTGAHVRFKHADCLATRSIGNFHAIISNPPYLTEKRWHRLTSGIKKWEPKNALVAADDGMAIHKRIIRQAKNRLAAGGFLALEMDPQQGPQLRHFLESHGYGNVRIVKDLQRRSRMILADYDGRV